MNSKKTWFITGASKGLGLAFVKELLQQGHQVAATSRKLDDLVAAVGKDVAGFFPLAVDLKTESSVRNAIAATIHHFGRIDVVVNNAGYGLVGSLEELTDQESRDNFTVNVFGTLNVIRNVMPYLREQRSGHIFNISSIGGFNGNFPGFGIYCATKFAVEGLSESLAAEAKEFGINVTIVSPGYFRTNFLESDSLRVPASEIAAYKTVREIQQRHQHDINRNQAGDPQKAAAVVMRVAEEKNPPLHLFLGADAYELAQVKIAAVEKDMESWESVATATAFEAAAV
ncbi:MAG TPA: oxidoreductase [Chitinophaga sp.]|uniref:oxidoreductase n=1 Tax=Chitinophaga sp. TaxID=1869181 RepID=UPI002DB73392|nr:oxidoreductase [Chitinophaga sp.]HEU4552240.1 oxidoreductase [Chitinophaga sp.]